ncbi:MAG TPA: ATP-binding cassette domain-containing protein [Candidatus Limnocylindria bacterium]
MNQPGEPHGLDARVLLHRGPSFRLEISLEIQPGRTVALLGPNGAGKSTAVAALAGLLRLEDGWIRLGSRTLDEPSAGTYVPPEARRIGVVFQDYLLFGHLSVVENIAFGLRSRGVRRAEARARATEWIERLGLDGNGERKPTDLSGGQAQRVALARALVTEPHLLLLDEPLAALDVTTRVELRRVLAEHLAAFAGPRLLITHDPTEAFLLADEIHVIEHGTVTQSGTADEIRRRPRTPYVADLSGSNLVTGMAADGMVDTGTHRLQTADHEIAGPVLAVIRAAAIAVHRQQPEGSPRNAWATRIVRLEHLGDRARLLTGDPLPLTAEVTEEAATELGLAVGGEVWLSIKATEIATEPYLPPDRPS